MEGARNGHAARTRQRRVSARSTAAVTSGVLSTIRITITEQVNCTFHYMVEGIMPSSAARANGRHEGSGGERVQGLRCRQYPPRRVRTATVAEVPLNVGPSGYKYLTLEGEIMHMHHVATGTRRLLCASDGLRLCSRGLLMTSPHCRGLLSLTCPVQPGQRLSTIVTPLFSRRHSGRWGLWFCPPTTPTPRTDGTTSSCRWFRSVPMCVLMLVQGRR